MDLLLNVDSNINKPKLRGKTGLKFPKLELLLQKQVFLQ
jgi:hypothetical protein